MRITERFALMKEKNAALPFFSRSYVRAAIIALLFAAGFLLRLNYAAKTDIYTRQHDIGGIGRSGHIGYIQYIEENGRLPDFDVRTKWQFYHPPLHHAIAAVWVKVQTLCGASLADAMMGVRWLTLLYSTLTMFIFYKILRLLGMKGAGLYAAFAVLALHPTFFILAGSINNDCLAVTLSFAAIYFALKWYKNPTFPSIICLAFSIGLAMMTKLSFWYLAPATALLFLLVLLRAPKKGRLIGQFAAFGGVCPPLGLFWPLRNLIGWGVPASYVPMLPVEHEQYVGFRSVWERLFDVYPSFAEDIFVCRGEKFGDSFFEYNIPADIIKTSVFGEFRIGDGSAVATAAAWILAAVNAVLIFGSVALGIWFLAKKWRDSGVKLYLYTLWATVMMSYTMFCFVYPHDCSMDFRYIVPTLAVGLIMLGLYAENTSKKPAKAIIACVCAVFCAASAVLYATV